jgi:hypothetical protein
LSDQRWSGIASTGQATAAEAANTRKVCLGCHVTSDGKDGNNVAVTATDEVEGIRRNDPSYVNKLKLPSTVPEHAYIASPTAGQSCYACHGNDYTGADTNNVHNPSGGAGTPGTDCKSCHNAGKSGLASFRNIQTDFNKTAQHAGTWSAINSRDCENCHYALHGGYPKLWRNATANHPASPVDGTDYFEYTKGTTVKARVNELCLSCHDGTAYNSLPTNTGGATGWQTATRFSTGGIVPEPDVGPRYNATGTTVYSKYSPGTYNVVPQITKAYSPHRLPVTNKTKPDFLGTAETHGYVDSPVNTFTDNTVGCLECHPSHGSNLVSGHGGDYSSSGLGKGGYMLTEENSKNEYGNIHDPSDNPQPGYPQDPYASEEELCWGCHVRGWDYRGDDTGTTRTRWQGSWQGDINWVTVKNGSFMSSHYYPNRPAMTSWTSGTPGSITRTNLACSTCHDAHGIDPGPGTTNAAYMVPALRGTWLTSPYKEDRPPSAGNYQTDTGATWRGVDKKGNYSATYYGPTASGGSATNKGARMVPDLGIGSPGTENNPTSPGFGYSATKSASVGDGYFIDENTFGVGSVSTTTSGGGWKPSTAPASQDWGSWGGPDVLNYSGAAVDPATKWWIRPKHFDGYLGYTSGPGLASSGGATPTVTPTGTFDENVFAGLCIKCHPRSTAGATARLTGTDAVYMGHVAVAGWHGDGSGTVMMSNDTNRPYMHQQQRVGINNYLAEDGTWGDLTNPPSTWSHDGPVGYRWGVDPGWIAGTGTSKTPTAKASVQGGYHRFPCSKCHTPHASRLPRLMVTNCLDVGSSNTQIKNTGYLYPQTTSVPSAGEFGLQGTEQPWEFAVTCHADRDGKPGSRSTGTSQQWYTNSPGTSGWNDVTPW